MLDLEIFGAKLREHRKKLGLTQEAVADRVGVSAQAVSKWESGECLPDCFNLKSLG
ncbi:MAG: helix-turn-helix transcriptional regulator [Candidatus Flemingibacterium sp.]|nr:helix-turn-helix transcriptional regulator [Candidatus Flemingibacterium sp.]